MRIDGTAYRTIWPDGEGAVAIIDQTRLPHDFAVVRLTSLEEAAHAIRAMLVRGAPLIGAAAAYGVALALRADASDRGLERACATLLATRPTAVNLRWALERMRALLAPLNCAETMVRVTAERALLAALDGSCRTPIAALAMLDGDDLHLRAKVLSPDGRIIFRAERRGKAAEAESLGADAGAEIRAQLPPDFFTAAPH